MGSSKQPTLLAAALTWIQLVLNTTGHDVKAAATELLRGGYNTALSATPQQDERSARRDTWDRVQNDVDAEQSARYTKQRAGNSSVPRRLRAQPDAWAAQLSDRLGHR